VRACVRAFVTFLLMLQYMSSPRCYHPRNVGIIVFVLWMHAECQITSAFLTNVY